MMTAQYIKVVTVLLALIAGVMLPAAISYHRRPERLMWLLLAAIELAWFSGVVALGYNFASPIRWYRTPVMLLASILALVYVALTVCAHRHRR